MTIERISTGIPTLDALIEGGIPKGFTVLVAGNPGTGKTILTSHFMYDGLLKGEAALCVSFSESKNQFYENFDRFGMRFSDLERDNKFAYLDFASITKEGITDALEEVLNVIRIIGAKRLVVDSFSAILLAFNNIILLRYVEADAKLKRSMLILKMRASIHDQSILEFAIQSKIGLNIIGEMSGYQGILSGIAQNVYQRYIEKEKKIQEKETRDIGKRKAKLDVRQKRYLSKSDAKLFAGHEIEFRCKMNRVTNIIIFFCNGLPILQYGIIYV